MVPAGEPATLCFVPETRILTVKGEVRVRDLRVGNLLCCEGFGGPVQPIKWIGKVVAEIGRHPRPERVRPVLIKPGALEDGVPARELRVSPDHAILRGCVLVPARLLMNGSTILQETDWPQITYYHIELARHAVIMADGAPAETFLDDGRRAQFSNSGVAVRFVDFESACASRGLTCFPVLRDEAITAPLRASLAARARDLGYQEVSEPDLRLQAGEIVLKAGIAGPGRYVFRLNAEAASIAQRRGFTLRSRLSTETSLDGCQRGAAISGLTLRAAGHTVSIGAADARLRGVRGLSAAEPMPPEMRGGPRRWLQPAAQMPAALLGEFPRLHPLPGNAAVLEIEIFLAEQDPFWLPAEAGPPDAPRKRRRTRQAEAPAPRPPAMLSAPPLAADDNPFRPSAAPGLGMGEREEAERAGEWRGAVGAGGIHLADEGRHAETTLSRALLQHGPEGRFERD